MGPKEAPEQEQLTQVDLLSWTFAAPPRNAESPLLIDALDPERSISYTELRTLVRRLIAGLRASGVGEGSCVCVSAFNDILYTVLYLGIVGAGGVFLGLNPSYTAHEIQHQFRMCLPKLCFVEEHTRDRVVEALDECGNHSTKVFLFDAAANLNDTSPAEGTPDIESWRVLLGYGESDWVRPSEPAAVTCHYASTSGTTGLPKVAMIPHSYHVTQAALRLSPGNISYTPIRLTALPPFHSFATPIIPSSIREGVPTYVMRRFEIDSFVDAVHRFGVSETWMPPPVMLSLAQSEMCTAGKMASIKQIWVAGAAVRFSSQALLYKKLGENARINVCWGLTECGWVAAGKWGDRIEDDAIGRVLGDFEVKVDAPDRSLASGVGELLIKGKSMALGYLGHPRSDLLGEEGFIRSGDIGTVHDGFVYILDRIKDMIKVRGWQVSPVEIEVALLRDYRVADAAVVGVPDGEDETPLAVVVPSKGYEPDLAALCGSAKATLASYKLPTKLVLVGSIPRNQTGKILRKDLRERYGRKPMG